MSPSTNRGPAFSPTSRPLEDAPATVAWPLSKQTNPTSHHPILPYGILPYRRFGLLILLTLLLGFVNSRGVYAQSSPGCASGACVSSGSRLTGVDGQDSELIDAMLGSLLGSDVDLSLLDYQALAATNITLDELQTGMNAATPGELLTEPTTLGELLTALNNIDGLSEIPAIDTLLGEVDALPTANTQLVLGDLLDIDNEVGSSTDVNLNALDLMIGSIQLFNAENLVTTPTAITVDGSALGLDGIGEITIQSQVIQPPLIACGPSGTTFYSAGVRVKLGVELLNLSLQDLLETNGNVGVGLTLSHLDLYLDVAPGSGLIQTIDAINRAVTVQATPGITDIYLGTFADNLFFSNNPISPADLTTGIVGSLTITVPGVLILPQTVLHVPGIGIKSYAQGTTAPKTLVFTGDPADSGTFPQTQTASAGASVVTSYTTDLITNLEIDASLEATIDALLGDILDGQLSLVVNALLDLLGIDDILDLTAPILDSLTDTLLPSLLTPTLNLVLADIADPLLEGLGIGLGEMDVTVLGIILVCPELTIHKSNSSVFAVGSPGQYTIQVTNTGFITTTTPITVVDTLPMSLTYNSHSGSGWTVVPPTTGQTITFTHATPLAPGAVLPSLILTVNLEANVPGTVINSVAVTTTGNHGGILSYDTVATTITGTGDEDGDGTPDGPDPDDTNPCIPQALADLCDQEPDGLTNTEEEIYGTNPIVADTDGDSFLDGNEVDNSTDPLDPCDPNLNATACDQEPDGLTNAEEITYGTDPTDPDTDNDGFSDGDEVDAPSNPLDPCDPNPNATACDNDNDGTPDGTDADDNNPCIPIAAETRCPKMAVSKSHVGSFATLTQNHYTVQITNTGQLTTSSPVTVVDTLPVSLTYASHAGTGWTLASNVGQVVTFVNSNTFAPGAVLPTLMITVSIPANAPSPVVNSVSVTTTNNVNSAASLDTDSTTIIASPDNDNDGEIGLDDPDDTDPCVPSDIVAACDNDADGTPDGNDPNDNDPCIPNVNAANCDNDDDDTPVDTDPDDNDPCIPNVNAANCDNDDDGTPVDTDPDDNDPCVPNDTVAACDTDADGTPDGNDPDDTNPCVPNDQVDVCDRDRDGLNNVEEEQHNTDPDNPDTDNDGINDGNEVDGDSDPLDPCDPSNTVPACDRDHDGLNNGEEAEVGTDPDKPDTDNDGVLDGDDPAPLNPCIPNANADACPNGLGEWNFYFYFPEIDVHKDLAPNVQ